MGINPIRIQRNRNGGEPDAAAQIVNAGWRVFEMGISYSWSDDAEDR